MRYLCTIYTEGGPVAMLPQSRLPLWDGGRDYFHAIGLDGYSNVLRRFKRACDVVTVQHESDGNFHVFASRTRFAVLSETYANEEHDLIRKLPALSQWYTPKPAARFKRFCGRVAVFDAALPGRSVRLRGAGFEQILYDEHHPDYQSAAVIAVERGEWVLREVYCKQPDVSFSGVVLRHVYEPRGLQDAQRRSKEVTRREWKLG